MKTAYLVTPRSQLKGWTLASDRAYFANPVEVEIVGPGHAGCVIVTDHRRGHTYPVLRSHLKSLFQLTNAQRRSLEASTHA